MMARGIFLIALLLILGNAYGQIIIPGEGLMDVKIGADWDEVEWELGFRGRKVLKGNESPELQSISELTGVDFDFVVVYQHIMWLPVSSVFFKDDKVCMIQLSSYPEYYTMLCVDIGTVEGLNFWDGKDRVAEIYGDRPSSDYDGKTFFTYRKGLGVELLDGEVRSMLIFQSQIE